MALWNIVKHSKMVLARRYQGIFSLLFGKGVIRTARGFFVAQLIIRERVLKDPHHSAHSRNII